MNALKLKTEQYSSLVAGFIFFLCLGLSVLFKNPFLLGIPFLCLFIYWATINLKSFYWFFIFSIPLSATIYFFNKSLSTTVPDEPLMWAFLLITIALLLYNYKIFPAWYFSNPIMLVLFLQVFWMIVALGFPRASAWVPIPRLVPNSKTDVD